MKRLRVFVRVMPFWNPCVWATDVDPVAEIPLIGALSIVAQRVPKFSFTLEGY